MRGADVELLRKLSRDFGKKESDVRSLISFLDTQTSSSESYWKGGKADKFRSDWTDFKPTMVKMAEALKSAKESANTNADNIERAT
ncbi:WXG100 family type VII secretion target [Streptomyces sp. AC563]|uniref:WXG100 family type VII secretion target n=2 Tax=Streptomyces buecherae TaxID=2763006 RepID=A0A7G8KN35_9ACTN|nr:WXG100 family type VII secretion target [Streptomyces buecherae]MBC3989239.1 WXG100 family type VII secretion target [Streptomyces buecherae]QKW54505.1 WXG100 family type VII secretion target [Streptomyces buecherae]QNJ44468.1 WXG100 family type VII secretion target [Streptomyces buecherae]